MSAVLVLAGAFGAVIGVGAVAVAINDAVERWLAARQAQGRSGGGGRPVAAVPVPRQEATWWPRPVVAARPTTLGRGASPTVGRRPAEGRAAAGVRRPG